MNYLEYLQYWKLPEYAQFIVYPHCLGFLEMVLQNPEFRRELAVTQFRDFVHMQQFYHWQHSINNRNRRVRDAAEEKQNGAAAMET